MQLPRMMMLTLAALVATTSTVSSLQFNAVASNDSNAHVEAGTFTSTTTIKIDASEKAGDGGFAVGSTVDVNPNDYTITTPCTAQSWTITQKKAASIWLQFPTMNLPQGDSLVVVAANGKEVPVQPSTDGSDVITAAVPGSTVTMQYRPSPTCSTAASFVLTKLGVRYTSEWLVTKEAVCGANTMQNVKCFTTSTDAEDKKMYDVSKAVLRTQRVRDDGKIVVCTAWLWGDKGHIVTNNHCFSSQAMVDAAQFDFGVEATSCDLKCKPGACPIARTIKGKKSIKFVDSDPKLDVSLLQIVGAPANEIVANFGFLRILFGMPTVGEQIYIPQHPGGSGRQIAKTDDDANSALATIKVVGATVVVDGESFSGLVGYSADTESGSSGSPVISRATNLVVGLHRIGYCNNAATPSKSLLGWLVPRAKANNGLFV